MSRRYTIEIKDAERPGQVVTYTAVEWADDERRAAIDQMRSWVGTPSRGRHSIEVKDAVTDRREFFSMADWSEAELGAVVRQVHRWAGVPDIIDFPDSEDDTVPPAANDDGR